MQAARWRHEGCELPRVGRGHATEHACATSALCREARVFQRGWLVWVIPGGPVRASVSAQRRASGIRNRPAMFWTRSAASVARIPAAVTNTGHAEVPRRTGMAWVGRAERGFGHADHRDAKLGVRVRTQAGPAT